MADKTWNIDYRGHRIRAINHLSWFPPSTGEALDIDGVKVIDAPGSFWRMTATHFVRHVLDGAERTIELRFANEKGSLGVGCEVFVDSVKIGGANAIMYPDPAETRRQLAKGGLHYFLTHGLPLFGLPYAIFMSLAMPSTTTAKTVVMFACYALAFGGWMSWFMWRGLVQAEKARAEFEAAHASRLKE